MPTLHVNVAPQTKTNASSTGGLIGVAAIALAAFVLLTTLYGIHRFYSPLLYWDEWDGYLGFYIRTLEHVGWHAWFDQHMEHRIFTSRVLFWLDLRFFQGNHILLFVADVVMLGVMAVVLTRESDGRRSAALTGIGIALMFSWIQSETLKWGFETQVLAAFMFAMVALTFFCQFDAPAPRRFILGYAAAILAEFSMGNGIAVFPILFFITLVARRPIAEILATAVLGVALIAVYFIGYSSPHLASDGPTYASSASTIVKFFFLLLGNPFAATGLVPIGVSIVIGAVTFVCASGLFAYALSTNQITGRRALWIGAYLYVLASVVAVTQGRSHGGLSQAILSRYTTGPLIGLLALLMFAHDLFQERTKKVAIVAVGLVVAMVVATGQRTITADRSYLFDWKMGVLSNKIGMDRLNYTSLLFPQIEPWKSRFVKDTTYGAEHQLGMYGEPWLREAGAVKFDASKVVNGCNGHVEHITQEGDGVLTVSGWLVTDSPDTLIVFADREGNTIGYGVTGALRSDVSAKFGGNADGGWQGFARGQASDVSAYVYRAGQFCHVQ